MPAASRDDALAGLGSLRQEQISVTLRAGSIAVRLTPLAEQVIALTAPDTHARLRALRQRWEAEAGDAPAAATSPVLVSFFAATEAAEFDADALTLTQHGRLLRPTARLPVTGGWTTGRLEPRGSAAAIYVFPEAVDWDAPVVLGYGSWSTDGWSAVRRTLRLERARVSARQP